MHISWPYCVIFSLKIFNLGGGRKKETAGLKRTEYKYGSPVPPRGITIRLVQIIQSNPTKQTK